MLMWCRVQLGTFCAGSVDSETEVYISILLIVKMDN